VVSLYSDRTMASRVVTGLGLHAWGSAVSSTVALGLRFWSDCTKDVHSSRCQRIAAVFGMGTAVVGGLEIVPHLQLGEIGQDQGRLQMHR
jgi:hypothetical protein